VLGRTIREERQMGVIKLNNGNQSTSGGLGWGYGSGLRSVRRSSGCTECGGRIDRTGWAEAGLRSRSARSLSPFEL